MGGGAGPSSPSTARMMRSAIDLLATLNSFLCILPNIALLCILLRRRDFSVLHNIFGVSVALNILHCLAIPSFLGHTPVDCVVTFLNHYVHVIWTGACFVGSLFVRSIMVKLGGSIVPSALPRRQHQIRMADFGWLMGILQG